MKLNLTTDRLSLKGLTLGNTGFIQELVNTEGWISFIGDRNVRNKEAAEEYIQKILDSKTVQYWVVKLKEEKTPIGIITFIKRDYLQYHDIGFAFLPGYSNKGYAFEAANNVLDMLMKDPAHQTIQATTVKENTRSIALLEKLGLKFEKEIEVGAEILLLFSLTVKI